MGSCIAAWYSTQTSTSLSGSYPKYVSLSTSFLGGRRFLILHLVRIVIVLLLGSLRDRKLRTIVSTHTLVLPFLPFLGGGRLLVLLVLPLRLPFLGGGRIFVLHLGLIVVVLLLRLFLVLHLFRIVVIILLRSLRCKELRTTASTRSPSRPDLTLPI
jgi:hypothetical protein